ncbi:hypothetical protein KNZ16_16220 [Streptococcus dysgalactiae subsp. equisimilis]|uniref:ThiF family adenylyltransferase n=1 Tax=Streptococcus dysgalactiae TaxID=1334 RepID=UPI0012CFCD93|nr:ThiF family adenylyltransferase [Streptococcus dysgalactiae]GET84902.1 hypothetical protein KNZ16_16220 [Streptococcus dysgalactiae subsp. equisimilis]
MYRLSDSIQIFENHDRKKIIIRNYGEGLVISIDRQNILIELFLFLKEYHTLEEIKSKFPTLSMDNIQEVVSYFLKLGILESQKVVNRKIKILLIGLGTTGSHIVESLSSLSCIEKLILVDSDKVSTTNLFRQSYSLQDLNEYKVDVFLNRKGRERVTGIKDTIRSENELMTISRFYEIDLIIQAADEPSPRELGRLVCKVSNKLNIPYITNMGYASNVISLPEFYFPNTSYHVDYKHNVNNEKLITSQILSKASYLSAIQPSLVIARQIMDYCCGKTPIFYKKRGFFNNKKLAWEVESIE